MGENVFRILRAIGRALVGAFAGFVVVALTLMIAIEYFGLFDRERSPSRDMAVWSLMVLGVVVFACVAVVSGRSAIPGKAGATLQAGALGTVAGILAGYVLGGMIGGPKAGAAAGIFLGAALGGLIGGIIGFEGARSTDKKPPDDPDF